MPLAARADLIGALARAALTRTHAKYFIALIARGSVHRTGITILRRIDDSVATEGNAVAGRKIALLACRARVCLVTDTLIILTHHIGRALRAGAGNILTIAAGGGVRRTGVALLAGIDLSVTAQVHRRLG